MLIKAIYEAFGKALIRFFNNRFKVSDEISYLRMELEKSRQEYQKLLDYITAPKTKIIESSDDESELIPANHGVKLWPDKRRELELASRRRAQELAREAKQAIESSKSTEELESELLTGTN